ncbi:MAG: NifU family protein [Synergistaceae bacterium]|jgi:Fe-S cluster biogenesis protein NfuA|nr:NifU family protein [Synergistaceae bacterium]
MSDVSEKIVKVIDADVRPVIESHGGGIEFLGFDETNGILKVELTGVCNGCPGAAATVRNMVEGVIQKSVPEVREVVRA